MEGVNYLDLTPFHNFNFEYDENNLVTVLVPRFTDKILSRILLPRLKSPYIKMKLDELGTETWNLIDGKRTVKQIADLLTSKFGDRVQPVYERLTTFLTQMYKQEFISFNELK
ncbi:MAG: PqqD family protein [Ignavibacteria bacterium]|nr:PqqD family protein [Ignavibacteria bacterium]